MKSLTLVFLSLVFAVFATAQGLPPVPPGGSVYASGLEGPRGLTFGPDGLLYVAEAGHGGTDPAVPTAMTFDHHGDIFVSDLGAAPPGAGRILRFANPISGRVITTVEVRPPAPLRDCESNDEHDER
jgi:hypothetical protein